MKCEKASKNEIRERVKALLKEQATVLRDQRSRIIAEKAVSLEQFRRSDTVMMYVPLPTEVDTTRIMERAWEQGKRVAVPFIDEKDRMEMKLSGLASPADLDEGPFGIRQPAKGAIVPIQAKEIDLVLVPAIAFDIKNNRLGRGKGYYDRFLSSLPVSACTVGLAFHFQIQKELPKDPHDIAVDMVLTD